MKIPISVAIITRDEEANIRRCLESVTFADDIVVLDSESADRTVEIAKSLGARVFVEPFRGFGLQKRRAVELCRHDWVLSLDADEALSEPAKAALQTLVTSSELRENSYRFSRLSFHMGRWIRHGGWYPDWQIRFFNRQNANWSDSHVHEKVQSDSVGTIGGDIHHWVFDDLTDQIKTNNNYSSLGARQLAKKGRRFSMFRLIFKPVSKFLETYIWKRGFLDGLPGFIIAVGAAYSVFLKFAKLWEIEHKS